MIQRLWPDSPTRWRDVPEWLLPALVSSLRLSVAAVLGYLATLPLLGSRVDLTGALTALLVVQATATSTVRAGLVRVGAVVTGVLVAVLLTVWVGLTWWSLGIAVAVALSLAKTLRLGEQALEAPISAMLILGVDGAAVAWETRLETTLVGTGVGIALGLLAPPGVPIRPAMASVRRVSMAISSPLLWAAEVLVDRAPARVDVAEWLDDARSAADAVSACAHLVGKVAEAQRLNARTIGRADVVPVLRSGLDTLEGVSFAVRALFVSVLNELPRDTADDVYGQQAREAFAVVLQQLAKTVDDFGLLVVAEAQGREVELDERLRTTVDAVAEARAILTELLFVDGRANPSLWLLRGSVLGAVEEVLRVVDADGRARLRMAWQRGQAGRRVTTDTGSLRVIGPAGGS